MARASVRSVKREPIRINKARPNATTVQSASSKIQRANLRVRTVKLARSLVTLHPSSNVLSATPASTKAPLVKRSVSPVLQAPIKMQRVKQIAVCAQVGRSRARAAGQNVCPVVKANIKIKTARVRVSPVSLAPIKRKTASRVAMIVLMAPTRPRVVVRTARCALKDLIRRMLDKARVKPVPVASTKAMSASLHAYSV